jgi:hypothetical protein
MSLKRRSQYKVERIGNNNLTTVKLSNKPGIDQENNFFFWRPVTRAARTENVRKADDKLG